MPNVHDDLKAMEQTEQRLLKEIEHLREYRMRLNGVLSMLTEGSSATMPVVTREAIVSGEAVPPANGVYKRAPRGQRLQQLIEYIATKGPQSRQELYRGLPDVPPGTIAYLLSTFRNFVQEPNTGRWGLRKNAAANNRA